MRQVCLDRFSLLLEPITMPSGLLGKLQLLNLYNVMRRLSGRTLGHLLGKYVKSLLLNLPPNSLLRLLLGISVKHLPTLSLSMLICQTGYLKLCQLEVWMKILTWRQLFQNWSRQPCKSARYLHLPAVMKSPIFILGSCHHPTTFWQHYIWRSLWSHKYLLLLGVEARCH